MRRARSRETTEIPVRGSLPPFARKSPACASCTQLISIALDALVSPQREIVLMFHQQGWPVERISKELSMPEGTVKSHLFRARRRMLEAIEHSGSVRPEEIFR